MRVGVRVGARVGSRVSVRVRVRVRGQDRTSCVLRLRLRRLRGSVIGLHPIGLRPCTLAAHLLLHRLLYLDHVDGLGLVRVRVRGRGRG